MAKTIMVAIGVSLVVSVLVVLVATLFKDKVEALTAKLKKEEA